MTTTTGNAVIAPAPAPPRRPAGSFRRLLRKPLGVIPLIIFVVLVLLGILGPLLADNSPTFASLDRVNASAGSSGWLLGGDQYGRDIWARVLASIRVSLTSAVIGAGVGVFVGTTFGLIAGYIGAKTDSMMSWIFNLLMAFPGIVLLIVLFPVTGGTYQATMLVFGFLLSPGVFRLVRNLVLGVRNELYVDAARVSGLSNRRILSRHVLYAVRGPLIIATAFLSAAAIGVQAGLAFLGFGAATTPSFGSMTSDAFLNIFTHPIQLVWSAGFLALLNGSIVLLASAYRDVLAAPQGKMAKRRRGARPEKPVAAADPAPKPAAADGLLTVRNLRVRYPQADGSPKEVVSGVSFEVGAGEIVGLVGESGSGKTQTAFSILGVLPKQAIVEADSILIGGRPMVGRGKGWTADLRSTVGYIPQEPMSNLDPSFTVGSQLVEGLSRSMSRREAKRTILDLLARVGIQSPDRTFASYPHQISGGMAQRVLIAGAVATRPKLLIADEPTTALDVTVQAEILDLLRDLQAEYDMGVLLVTHNFGVVVDLCDRVIVMRSGELVESGTVRAVFREPQHPYTQRLVAAILDEEAVRTDPAPVAASAHAEEKA